MKKIIVRRFYIIRKLLLSNHDIPHVHLQASLIADGIASIVEALHNAHRDGTSASSSTAAVIHGRPSASNTKALGAAYGVLSCFLSSLEEATGGGAVVARQTLSEAGRVNRSTRIVPGANNVNTAIMCDWKVLPLFPMFCIFVCYDQYLHILYHSRVLFDVTNAMLTV